MNKSKVSTGVYVGIYALSVLFLARIWITPSLASMAAEFPNVSRTLLMQTMAIPALAMIPFSLIVGPLEKYFTKKTLALIGVILGAIGGVGPAFANDFTVILVLRGILGLGMGFFVPLSSAFIADYFVGDQRSKLMGLQQMVASIAAIVLTLAAGFLAVLGWRYVYSVYAIAIVVLLITIITLPNKQNAPVIEKTEEKPKFKFTASLNYVLFISFIFIIFFDAFGQNLSLFIEGEKIGDPSLTGMVASIMTVGSIVTGAFFGLIAKSCKKFTFSLGFLMGAIGLFILGSAHSPVVALIGGFFVGVSLTIWAARQMFELSVAVHPVFVTTAIALGSVLVHVGEFVSPPILNTMSAVFGDGSSRSAYISSSVAMLILAVIYFLVNLRKKSVKESDTVAS